MVCNEKAVNKQSAKRAACGRHTRAVRGDFGRRCASASALSVSSSLSDFPDSRTASLSVPSVPYDASGSVLAGHATMFCC